MREYFNAYHSMLQAVEPLDDAERGRLFTALLIYSATGSAPALRGNERFLFPALRGQIDRDRERYEQRCEQNRRNGALGGRAAGQKPTAPQTPPKTKTKEKAKEKAKEKTKAKEKASSPGASPAGDGRAAEEFFEQNFGPVTPYLAGRLRHYRDCGVEERLLTGALEEAARTAASAPWRYAEAILDGCLALGQKTFGEWSARRAGGRPLAPETGAREDLGGTADCLGRPDRIADPRSVDYLPVFRLRPVPGAQGTRTEEGKAPPQGETCRAPDGAGEQGQIGGMGGALFCDARTGGGRQRLPPAADKADGTPGKVAAAADKADGVPGKVPAAGDKAAGVSLGAAPPGGKIGSGPCNAAPPGGKTGSGGGVSPPAAAQKSALL